MAKKPNAANITHGLAQLGGGSKKDGGGGMAEGLKYIFAAGVQIGSQSALNGGKTTPNINFPNNFQLGAGTDDLEDE